MEPEAIDSNAIDKLNCLWNWINNFIIKPNKELGREGPVCPFCPSSMKQQLMKIYIIRQERSYNDIEPILLYYRNLFLKKASDLGENAIHQTFILLFSDIKETNYHLLIDNVQKSIKPKFVVNGLMIGEFHPLQESEGIHNSNFRPLRAPVPLLVIRHMTKLDIQFLNTPEYSLELRIQFMSAYLQTFSSPEVEKLLSCAKKQLNDSFSKSLRNSQYSYMPTTNFNGEKQWTILYGTQTGTAALYANNLSKILLSIAKKKNCLIRVLSMDEYEYKSEFSLETYLFVITSTFGSGDPPNMGRNFKQFLYTLPTDNFEFTGKYCVLGLGSKLYPNYCKWASELNTLLKTLGGNRLFPIHYANDLENQQVVFQYWVKELVLILKGTDNDLTISQKENELWTITENGIGCPKLSRVSDRIDNRSILDKTVQALRFSYGCNVPGVYNCLIGAANLLQTSISSSVPTLEQVNISDGSIRKILQSAAKVDETKTRTFDFVKVFDSFDRDGDGVISYKEFEIGIKQLGVTIDHSTLSDTLKVLDKNGDGQISIEEFVGFISNSESNLLAGSIISTRIKPISRQYPFFATVIENTELYSSKSTRSCRLIKFDISDYGSGSIFYKPGDHLGIFPENDPQLVHSAIKLLRINNADIKFDMNLTDPSLSIAIKSPLPQNITYWQALSAYVDLQKPPSSIMCKTLANYCENDKEQNILIKLGNDVNYYEHWIQSESPTIISFLSSFTSLNLSNHLGTFFEFVPPMLPRWYSICSSLNYSPKEVHICVAHFAYRSNNGDIRKGICSDWLRKHCPSSIIDRTIALPIFTANSTFHLPEDSKKPIIMIATGTGITPFRSFWQERLYQQNKDNGEFILYYGCRSPDEQIFKEELDNIINLNVFSRIKIAYSRSHDKNIPNRRISVDLQDDAEYLYDLCLNKKGHIFLCGDISIAESLKNALNEKWSKLESNQTLFTKMKKEERLHEDIFGSFISTKTRIDELNNDSVKGL